MPFPRSMSYYALVFAGQVTIHAYEQYVTFYDFPAPLRCGSSFITLMVEYSPPLCVSRGGG